MGANQNMGHHFIANGSPYALYKINGTKYYEEKLLGKRATFKKVITSHNEITSSNSSFEISENGQLSLAV